MNHGLYDRIHISKKELKKYTFENNLVFHRENAKGTSLKVFYKILIDF
jgi:hypothetical protein